MKKLKQDKIKIIELEFDQEADRSLTDRADNLLADWLISLYFKREVDNKKFALYNSLYNKEVNNYASPGPSGCIPEMFD